MAKITIVRRPRRSWGLTAGDAVTHEKLGHGVVVGFSSLTSEPFVFFYSRQEAVCLAHEELSFVN